MSGKVIPVVRAEEEEEELVDPQTQLRVSSISITLFLISFTLNDNSTIFN